MMILEYPYLMVSMKLMAISLAGIVFFRRHRKTILISGLLSLPCSLTTFFFVPEYWEPVRLFGSQLGIEDIFFSFSTGMIAWMISLLFYRNIYGKVEWPMVIPRYVRVLCIGVPMIFVMRQTGMMVMTQALIGITLISMILSWNRWLLIPKAVLTGVVFAAFYTVFVGLIFIKFPEFHAQWTHSNLSGISTLGIPLEETLWAFIFGTCWIITMGYVFDFETRSFKFPKQ